MLFNIVLSVLFLSSANAARILGIFMTPSYSHQVVYQPIWKELSLKGHQVTIVTPNPLKDSSLTNLTEIDLSESYGIWKNHSVGLMGTQAHSTMDEVKQITDVYMALSEWQLSQPQVKDLIYKKQNQEFDLILVEFLWPVMYAFKDIYNCPMVGITSLGLTATAYDALGMPKHPILDPEFALPFATQLTFKERVISSAFYYLIKSLGKMTIVSKINTLIQTHFGPVRSIKEIVKDVSLVIANSNVALQPIKPTVPAFIEISGIHIKPKKALPKDLQVMLDEAKEGVIYFSLGSNVKSYLLPPEKLKSLMEALGQLPYKVLWKFETDEIPNKPDNIEIRKWLPQQDVLGHKNIKAFITQGGLQSLDETISNEVPVIGIPFFGDQRHNIDRITKNGAGIMINFHDFTVEELKEKIIEVVENPKYKEKMQHLNSIAYDHPISALDKAIWWIEYVLRHDGAAHLRYDAVDMPFYQYYMLDVYMFFILLLSTITYILKRIIGKVVIGYRVCVRVLQFLSTKLFNESQIAREHAE